MTDAELIELVRQMREAQKHFFALRRQPGDHIEALDASKRLDRQVDNPLAERAQGGPKQERLL
jgi:hypothetical protein